MEKRMETTIVCIGGSGKDNGNHYSAFIILFFDGGKAPLNNSISGLS